MELDKYKKGVQWLNELLYKVQFEVDRLKIIISKITNDVARMKRNGRTVVNCVLKNMLFNKGGCGMRRYDFLKHFHSHDSHESNKYNL